MRRWDLLSSFGTIGDCFDSAAMESFRAWMQGRVAQHPQMGHHYRTGPWPWPITSTTSTTLNSATATGETSAPQSRNALDVHLFRSLNAHNHGFNEGDKSGGLAPSDLNRSELWSVGLDLKRRRTIHSSRRRRSRPKLHPSALRPGAASRTVLNLEELRGHSL